MAVYGKVLGNATSYSDSFVKEDSSIVAFSKANTFAVTTATKITLELANKTIVIDSGTNVEMTESATTGADYTIWAHPTGNVQAILYTTTPPTANAKMIGGFHYAPGGNATANTGGDSTPQINEYSFWDLKFRPLCRNPKGMALVADAFWSDIYLTGNNAVTLDCSSVYDTTIADANSSPIVPIQFGGNGANTYGGYTWYEAQELAVSFGKRPPTQQEFMVLSYGTTEANSAGTDPVTTKLDAIHTSKWGIMQATGNMFVYTSERCGSNTAQAWHAVTEGRGSEYGEPYCVRAGGAWNSTTSSGSRCARGDTEAQTGLESGVAVNSSRFVSEHLQID